MKNMKISMMVAALAITLLFPCEVSAKSQTSIPRNMPQPATKSDDIASIQSIQKVCSLTSTPELFKYASQIRTDSDINPYDVIWDYGDAWDAYVKACDWDLVFDPNYYAKQFPMLAMQYHYDKDLLLLHFCTVGVHEGRQGSEGFNVKAYAINGSESVREAFKDNWEAYYLFYMLNYVKEQSVNTVSANDGSKLQKQYKTILTYMQALELDAINRYREKAGSSPVEFDQELAAIASYRAYINATEHIKAHDWLDISGNDVDQCNWIVTALNGTVSGSFSENNYEPRGGIQKMPRSVFADAYASSDSHYEAMCRPSQKWVGIGHMAWDGRSDSDGEQFDIYAQ